MIIFGDDGFRDKAEKGLLSHLFLKIFKSLNYVLSLKKLIMLLLVTILGLQKIHYKYNN